MFFLHRKRVRTYIIFGIFVYNLSNKYIFGFDFDVYGYTTRGNSQDYFYKTDGSFDKMISFCNELGSYAYGFYPPVDTTAITALSNFPFYDNIIMATGTYLDV